MATHSSILAWRIPWPEKPVRLPSVGLQCLHNWVTNSTLCIYTHTHTHTHTEYIHSVILAETRWTGYYFNWFHRWGNWGTERLNNFPVVRIMPPARIVVQWLSRPRLFMTPWIAAHQGSLSFPARIKPRILTYTICPWCLDFWLLWYLILGLVQLRVRYSYLQSVSI